MRRQTLNRATLSAAVSRQAGLHRRLAHAVVRSLIDEMGQALCRSETIKIKGFGTLVPARRRAKIGRNPRTGNIHPIGPQTVVLFRPGTVLRRAVAALPDRQTKTPDTSAQAEEH